MELWNKARSFAEETAKRTQDLSIGIGNTKFSDVVAEATKRSKEIAAQASKRADQIRIEAIKRADEIKTFADGIHSPGRIAILEPYAIQDKDLESFGITDELREFVQGITFTTFQDFPLQDDTELSDVPTVSNVRHDLTEWQERHANLVLSTVKEISKLRYELCPRVMKERKFWKIYFMLVNSHVAPFEKRYVEEAKLKLSEQVKDHNVEPNAGLTSNHEVQEVKNKKTSTEKDLDVFLLGDMGDSDDEPGDGDLDFDDDLNTIVKTLDNKNVKS